MQYYKPEGEFFVGDCMPFYHEGTLRLYYLLDEGHHTALGGLGGHQWAQASTGDLIHWKHHPLAIAITDENEGSICTGSVFFHEGTYYGFYATRRRDWTQHLSLALSQDGVHFEKHSPNPFASPPPGYNPLHYRDPVVFADSESGLFHLLATAELENTSLPDRGGCLAHLVSQDLLHWEGREPFLIPGLPGVPECPDYFAWNGWYYLIFSSEGVAHYRISRQPFGPWLRPNVDTFDGPAARVLKTAAYKGGRRLGAAWIGTRQDDQPGGAFQFGGNVVLREIIQYADGSLGTSFPPEVTPGAGKAFQSFFFPLTAGARIDAQGVHLAGVEGLAVAACEVGEGLAGRAYLSLEILPQAGMASFGLKIGAEGTFDSGVDLNFSVCDRTVHLDDQVITCVDGIGRPFSLEVVLQGDLVDVCVDGRRTLINRCPGPRGPRLLLYTLNGEVEFEVTDLRIL